VQLPLGVGHRCDVVVPGGPDNLVRLTDGGRHGGWPTVLQRSTPTGWKTIQQLDLPTPRARCQRVVSSSERVQYSFESRGAAAVTVQVLRHQGVWKVRRSALTLR